MLFILNNIIRFFYKNNQHVVYIIITFLYRKANMYVYRKTHFIIKSHDFEKINDVFCIQTYLICGIAIV